MAFTITSPAFGHGDAIGRQFTCDGDDVSPPLTWSGAPAGSLSLALLCDDPDAPRGTWHHWAIFDIPVDVTALPEGYRRQERVGTIRQAVNDFGTVGYGGPCPPPGHGVHHYHFRLLALDVETLGLGESAACVDVAKTAQPHILAQAELVGTYKR